MKKLIQVKLMMINLVSNQKVNKPQIVQNLIKLLSLFVIIN